MASSAALPVSSNNVVTSRMWHGKCSRVCNNAGPRWRVWESSSPHSKIRGQSLDLDVAFPVLCPRESVFNFCSFGTRSPRATYMLSEVSMPVGQSICNRDKISARSSCNRGWIFKDKLLIGATMTRCDAGMMFWRAFRKSSFSTLRNQHFS